MLETLQRFRLPILLALHALVFALAITLAFAIRFDMVLPAEQRGNLAVALPLFIVVKLAVFWAFRLYAGWWRYVGLSDLLRISAAALVAVPVLYGAVFFLQLPSFGRSIPLLDAGLTVALLATLRVSIRLWRERFRPQQDGEVESGPMERALVVGTGPNAEALLREAARNRRLRLQVRGLVDLDRRNRGTLLAGVPVRGCVEDIPALVRAHEIRLVIIALEEAESSLVRRIITLCNSVDVKHRVLPTTDTLLTGTVSMRQLREVSLQDLLGRPPVRLDPAPIAGMVSGQTVLVTGAGGSIGSELCRQVAAFGPAALVLVDQAENPLFHLERELLQAGHEFAIVPVIADVAEADRLHEVMDQHRPAFVLHAAAHKHVPLMERNPGEAIKNNVFGTRNVIRAAQQCGVDSLVLISTDKAVNPTSVMGASKRVAEVLMQALAPQSTTRLCAVRFGNVLGSNGSVIPIFTDQIRKGGPVTVTHPEMQRYFMTIPEASQLVLQAASYAEGGEVFVLDMGEPVKIVDVARDLIRLSGLEPDRDIAITFTGIRPGEKLFEELATEGEDMRRTEHGRIFTCATRAPGPEAVLRAMEGLDELARSGKPPAHVRRAFFAALQALEDTYA